MSGIQNRRESPGEGTGPTEPRFCCRPGPLTRRPLTRRPLTRRVFRVALVLAASGVLLLLACWLALPLVPLPPALLAAQPDNVEMVDRHDRPLRLTRPGDESFKQHVSFAEIPPPLVHATLAAEDRRFWKHVGVDWMSSMRAAWQWAWHGRVISGASTITQQIIKQAQPRPRSLRTKLIEAAQALRLEQVWNKQRILAEYLNRIEYGNLNAGCAAAARFYFDKPLADLSPAECALLAGLPQGPTRLNPRAHPDRARKRQLWILQGMRDAGWLSPGEFSRATQEPLVLSKSGRSFEAPHFIDLLLQQTARSDEYPEPDGGIPADGPRKLRTTLDLELNRVVEQSIRAHLARLRQQQVGDAAAVVIENRSGDVLALVGSGDYFSPDSGQVNGAWSPRSAGSTFKPFTYLLALESGATPATVVADVPTEFATPTGIFAPVNYSRHCHGPMRYREALASSQNIPAVKVLASIGGPAPLKTLLCDCGLDTLTQPPEYYGLGLTIGNAEARLLELANAYACLARLGHSLPCRLLADAPVERGKRVADAGAAFLIADILADNTARAMAFGTESALRFEFPVACKTGTSSDFRDNWAFGYTPEFTVGVWAGNFSGAPMQQVSGVSGAAPILHDIFEHLHDQRGTTWYATPTNVFEQWIHPLTGKARQPADAVSSTSSGATQGNTPGWILEKFLVTAPPEPGDGNDFDSSGRLRLSGEYREWLASGDNWLGDCLIEPDRTALKILCPLPGTTLFLDPDLPGKGRKLFLRAEGSTNVQWRCDSLECRNEGGRSFALLQSGRHTFDVTDPLTGLRAQTWINVLPR